MNSLPRMNIARVVGTNVRPEPRYNPNTLIPPKKRFSKCDLMLMGCEINEPEATVNWIPGFDKPHDANCLRGAI